MRTINSFMLLLLPTVLLGQAPSAAAAQNPSSPSTQPPMVCSAADGIFAAFQSHPLVGLGDYHGLAQLEDFFTVLIRDKRFAKDVGNVVVEFGDAAQQNTLDRYLAGEDIPYDQLRRVWSDTVGWIPTVTAIGYINFYAQVRAVNLELPPEHRIHVWLGDPPIDWSKVKTREDYSPHVAKRDQYPAEIIRTQILDKNKKALVIYGTFHLWMDHCENKSTAFDLTPFSWSLPIPDTKKDYALVASSRLLTIGHSPHSPSRSAKAVSHMNCLRMDVASYPPQQWVWQTRRRQKGRKRGRYGNQGVGKPGQCAPLYGARRKSYPSSGNARSLSRL